METERKRAVLRFILGMLGLYAAAGARTIWQHHAGGHFAGGVALFLVVGLLAVGIACLVGVLKV
jgi:hypothetical protein